MVSIEEKLGRLTQKFNRAQLKSFRERTQGGESAETLLCIAEAVMAESGSEFRESGRSPIRRNNGGSFVEESGYSMEKADEVLFTALQECRPQAFKKGDEVRESAALTAKQREDFEFSKLIGLSEAEALKVALSGDIRG